METELTTESIVYGLKERIFRFWSMNPSVGTRAYYFYTIIAPIEKFGYIVSNIILTIHLYKFINANKPHSLPSKNLASYAFCLIMRNLCQLCGSLGIFNSDLSDNRAISRTTITSYFQQSSTLWIFIMSLDMLISIRKSIVQFRISNGPRHKIFLIYSIVAWCFPFLIFPIRRFDLQTYIKYNALTMIVIRFVCVILYVILICYIKSADIRNMMKYSLHTRLLVVNGVTSFFTYLSFALGVINSDITESEWGLFIIFSLTALNAYCGVLIGFAFTFKKNMFNDDKVVKSSSVTLPMKRI